MAFTDTAVRNAKPGEKPYELTHAKGLYLLVNATGKYWRLDYRFAGKRKTLALGVYPDVSSATARNACGRTPMQTLIDGKEGWNDKITLLNN